VQPPEHVPLNDLPGHTQEGADERRPDGFPLSRGFRKGA